MPQRLLTFCTLLSVLLFTSPVEANLRSTAEPKNMYRTELKAYLDSQETLPTPPQINDQYDKIFLEILSETVETNTKIIEVNANLLPQLYEDLELFCSDQHISMPRLYIAINDHIDAKFCTYNLEGALLINRGTFEVFSSRVFRGYLQQVLLRMRRRYDNHRKIALKHNTVQYISLGIAAALNIGAVALGATVCNNWGWKGSAAQMALAGASSAALYHIFTQRFSTHSYERIASFHNQEMAREDVFPGKSPEETLEATYNPSSDHAMLVIAQTQQFIRDRDREFAQLQEMESDGDE